MASDPRSGPSLPPGTPPPPQPPADISAAGIAASQSATHGQHGSTSGYDPNAAFYAAQWQQQQQQYHQQPAQPQVAYDAYGHATGAYSPYASAQPAAPVAAYDTSAQATAAQWHATQQWWHAQQQAQQQQATYAEQHVAAAAGQHAAYDARLDRLTAENAKLQADLQLAIAAINDRTHKNACTCSANPFGTSTSAHPRAAAAPPCTAFDATCGTCGDNHGASSTARNLFDSRIAPTHATKSMAGDSTFNLGTTPTYTLKPLDSSTISSLKTSLAPDVVAKWIDRFRNRVAVRHRSVRQLLTYDLTVWQTVVNCSPETIFNEFSVADLAAANEWLADAFLNCLDCEHSEHAHNFETDLSSSDMTSGLAILALASKLDEFSIGAQRIDADDEFAQLFPFQLGADTATNKKAAYEIIRKFKRTTHYSESNTSCVRLALIRKMPTSNEAISAKRDKHEDDLLESEVMHTSVADRTCNPWTEAKLIELIGLQLKRGGAAPIANAAHGARGGFQDPRRHDKGPPQEGFDKNFCLDCGDKHPTKECKKPKCHGLKSCPCAHGAPCPLRSATVPVHADVKNASGKVVKSHIFDKLLAKHKEKYPTAHAAAADADAGAADAAHASHDASLTASAVAGGDAPTLHASVATHVEHVNVGTTTHALAYPPQQPNNIHDGYALLDLSPGDVSAIETNQNPLLLPEQYSNISESEAMALAHAAATASHGASLSAWQAHGTRANAHAAASASHGVALSAWQAQRFAKDDARRARSLSPPRRPRRLVMPPPPAPHRSQVRPSTPVQRSFEYGIAGFEDVADLDRIIALGDAAQASVPWTTAEEDREAARFASHARNVDRRAARRERRENERAERHQERTAPTRAAIAAQAVADEARMSTVLDRNNLGNLNFHGQPQA